ncbi:MAG TPA: lysylphosphatidylglycerol synthase domain-containing protein, partial [Planctomycetota bacterium]|nr:lysylphosphatidylglycerol synthase domain-containing protein [Planctomycetota bacterium]
MSAVEGSVRKGRLLSVGLLVLGLLVLGLTAREVNLPQAWRELARVGGVGCAAFLLNIVITIGGPFLGWHLLMRSLDIPVALPTTLLSGLIGRACNLLSPVSYFGGEGVRTFHVASMTGAPRRRVLAALVVSEFQVMAGLTVFTLLGLGISLALSTLGGARLAWALAGAGTLALGLLTVLGLALGDVKPCLRILDALVRRGIFPRRLAALRGATLDLENLIRSLFRDRRGTFFLAQALSLSSPV